MLRERLFRVGIHIPLLVDLSVHEHVGVGTGAPAIAWHSVCASAICFSDVVICNLEFGKKNKIVCSDSCYFLM